MGLHVHQIIVSYTKYQQQEYRAVIISPQMFFIKGCTTRCCAVNRSFDNQQNTDAKKTIYLPPISPK